MLTFWEFCFGLFPWLLATGVFFLLKRFLDPEYDFKNVVILVVTGLVIVFLAPSYLQLPELWAVPLIFSGSFLSLFSIAIYHNNPLWQDSRLGWNWEHFFYWGLFGIGMASVTHYLLTKFEIEVYLVWVLRMVFLSFVSIGISNFIQILFLGNHKKSRSQFDTENINREEKWKRVVQVIVSILGIVLVILQIANQILTFLSNF